MRKSVLVLLLVLVLINSLFAQILEIKGRILDSKGNAIIGASIHEKNSTRGTTTDENGNFLFQAHRGTTLIITSVGFERKEINVASETNIDLVLQQEESALSEVIVTGYTTVQKSRYSGASASVPITKIRTQPMASFDQALQGNAAGVSVIATSGQPGAQGIIRIRGNGSISGNNSPLYILDGIQISAGDFASMNQGDFESVDILKDAVATSMYGSRGANGVIVITTRRGSVNQIQLNYDGQVGFSVLPKDRLVMMNSQQKIEYELRRGNPYNWSDAVADSLQNINFNWREALFRTGVTQQHQISASGGGQNSTFYASLSYMDQDGIVKKTGLKRYTGRINVDNTIKNFRFGLSLQGGFSKLNNTPEGGTFLNMPLNAIRWSNPYDTDFNPTTGDYNQTLNPTTGVPTGQFRSGQPNGALELFENERDILQAKGIAISYLEYHLPFVQGLKIRTNWGIDYSQNESNFFISPKTSAGIARVGALTRGLSRNFRYTGTTSINYQKTLGSHDFQGGLFTEVVKNNFRTFSFTGYGFTSDFKNEAGITPGSATNQNFIPTVGGNGTQNSILSYFAILNYTLNEKYFIDFVVRRDGSSTFGANNRFANFGSVGIRWKASQEIFFNNINALSDLDFRASIGTTGNRVSPLEDYPIPYFGPASYAGTSGLVPASPGNLDYSWEKNRTINIGFDYGLFLRRIFASIDLYDRTTKDLFFSLPVDPAGSGFTSIPGNYGGMRNRGIEVALTTEPVRTKDFRWTLGGNITYNRNTITDLQEDTVITSTTVLAKGFPLNSYYLVDFAGVNTDNGNALYRTRTGALTETYNPGERVIWGTADAPWFGGFNTSISYKGFDLSAQLNFFLGRVLFNNERNNVINPQYYTDNMAVEMMREWQKPGDITDVPRATSAGGNAYQFNTTRLLEDASYWRLRNVTLAYNVNQNLLSGAGIRSARFYVQGQNWWTWTRFQSFDPELTQGSAHTGAQYPALIQTTVGVSIGF